MPGAGPYAGNYSDGNLVATLLSHYLNVTQCTIAHALEKTKYEDADIYWCGHPSLHHHPVHISLRNSFTLHESSVVAVRCWKRSAVLLLLPGYGEACFRHVCLAVSLCGCRPVSRMLPEWPASQAERSMPGTKSSAWCLIWRARRKKMDADYHFSCQFTADVIAMNHADFVLTSTLQEIAGTPDTMGQCDPTP